MTIQRTFSELIKMFVGLLLLFFISGCNSSQPKTTPVIELRGSTMGTTYLIKVVNDKNEDSQVVTAAISTGIDNVLKTVNRQMSSWLPDSEISRFNHFGSTDWFEVSPDTATVVAEAVRIGGVTGGALDVTLSPLIDLWGFGPKNTHNRIPSDEEINSVLVGIGYQKLSVRQAPPAIKKENSGIQVQLAAVAKGFGVDKVADYLDSEGFSHYLVEIGGEVRARGKKPENKSWHIAVSTPDDSGSYQKVLVIENVSVATSGDYHNYFEKDGVRFAHILDPTTGRPITHNLASITVVHNSCMTADALATGLYVLGPEKSYELALKENIPVFMIIRESGKFVEKYTPTFSKMLESEDRM